MFTHKSGIRLFNLFGFAVSADWSWLIVAVLLSWSLAAGYYPAQRPGLAPGSGWLLGMLSAAFIFLSVVLHEIGHSYVARSHGIRILGIRLFVFGGVAQMDREPQSPLTELKVALAGPAVSAGLAVLFFAVSLLAAAMDAVALQAFTLLLAQANTGMVLFNMIPGFPMDGGRVLRAVLWGWRNDFLSATKTASDVGRYVAVGFMVFGGLGLLFGAAGGLWLALIGIFLYQAAKASLFGAYLHNWQHGWPQSPVLDFPLWRGGQWRDRSETQFRQGYASWPAKSEDGWSAYRVFGPARFGMTPVPEDFFYVRRPVGFEALPVVLERFRDETAGTGLFTTPPRRGRKIKIC